MPVTTLRIDKKCDVTLRMQPLTIRGLTPRQVQVFELMFAGHGLKQTAVSLGISQALVKYHRRMVYRKLGMSLFSGSQIRLFEMLKISLEVT